MAVPHGSLVSAYYTMCRAFRVPRTKRISPNALRRMSDEVLLLAVKDLYFSPEASHAHTVAKRLGLIPESERATTWLEKFQFLFDKSGADESHAVARYRT